jgi:putative hemolysin
MLDAKCLLGRLLAGESFDLNAAMIPAQFVPASMLASKVLDVFRDSAVHIAVVVGEYGGMEGLITMQDILEEIVGGVEETAPQATQREDGSWLIDGLIPIDDFKDLFDLEEMTGEHDGYTTLGGFVMAQVGSIPKASDSFEWETFRFEVMDMDGNRVDKVLVTRKPPASEEAPETSVEEVKVEVKVEVKPAGDTPL